MRPSGGAAQRLSFNLKKTKKHTDCREEHIQLQKSGEIINCPINEKPWWGWSGDRKDGEGQRGELLQDGRGRTSGGRARAQDRLKRNKAKCSLYYFCEEHGD